MANIKIVRNCKDCGKPFDIDKKEAAWYSARNLDIPSRCAECRRKRKEASGGTR